PGPWKARVTPGSPQDGSGPPARLRAALAARSPRRGVAQDLPHEYHTPGGAATEARELGEVDAGADPRSAVVAPVPGNLMPPSRKLAIHERAHHASLEVVDPQGRTPRGRQREGDRRRAQEWVGLDVFQLEARAGSIGVHPHQGADHLP